MNHSECENMSLSDRQMTKAPYATRDQGGEDPGHPDTPQLGASKVSRLVTQTSQVPEPLLAACSNGGLERYMIAKSYATRFVPGEDEIESERVSGQVDPRPQNANGYKITLTGGWKKRRLMAQMHSGGNLLFF